MTLLTKIAERVQSRLADSNLKLEENPVAQAVQENRKRRGRRKKATPAQMRARAEFARRARSGAFRRKKSKRRGRKAQESLQQNRGQSAKAALEENRGRKYAQNRRGRRREEENEENEMAAELEENKKRSKKRGKKKRKSKRRARRRTGTFASLAPTAPRRRRRRKARKARKARKSRRGGHRRATRVVKTHVVTLPRSQVQVMERKRVRRRKKRGGKRRRKSTSRRKRAMLMENPGFFSGPGPNALYENQGGPFTMAGLRAYGVAALGVGVGLIVADVTDRLIATRTPKDGKNPWYGKDAAGAIRMRPDAWRLGGQAGGAVAGMALAYVTRGRGVVPWLLGGIAVGFGSNLVKQLWDWYGAPAIMKVELADAGKPSVGNRLYSLEQNYIQDQVAKIFAQRPFAQTLAPGQNDPPQITSPLGGGGSGAGPMYQLAGVGRPGQNARSVVRTGRLGTCAECGCSDGCYSNCPTICPNCPEFNQNTMCRHVVQAGDNIADFAAAGGVSVDQINAMNNDPSGAYWQPGATVMLPYGVCSAMEKGTFTPVQPETSLPQVIETTNIAPPAEIMGGVYGVGNVGNIPDDDYLKRAAIFSGANRQ